MHSELSEMLMEILKEHMEREGMTSPDHLAEMIGMNKGTVYGVLKGKRKASADLLYKWLRELGYEINISYSLKRRL